MSSFIFDNAKRCGACRDLGGDHTHAGDCQYRFRPAEPPSTVIQTKYPERFITKDSGERIDFPSGMRRDTDKGKARYDLIPRFMLRRIAELYARGAEKYDDNNWTLANSEEELRRFEASAFRHFIQWLDGDRDEDHAAATFFNIAAAEHVRKKLMEEGS